jgi:hypothetical protein
MLCKSNATTVVAGGRSYITRWDSDETHPDAWPCDHDHADEVAARACASERWARLAPVAPVR